MWSHQDESLMRTPAVNFFLAHLRPPGEGQFLKDHLLRVSAITSRLAAKVGMPRVGALIGLAHDLGKYLHLLAMRDLLAYFWLRHAVGPKTGPNVLHQDSAVVCRPPCLTLRVGSRCRRRGGESKARTRHDA